jgi:hypothetical protein
MLVSTNVVRCAFHEANLGLIEKWKNKSLLTSKSLRCRWEFAQRHQNWTIHDWYTMIFSEETKINWFQCKGRTWCWVRDGESQVQAHHVIQRVKHGGGAIFVWDCMTSCGMGYMCKIDGKVTQAHYLRFSKMGSWRQLNGTLSTLRVSYFSMIMILN